MPALLALPMAMIALNAPLRLQIGPLVLYPALAVLVRRGLGFEAGQGAVVPA